MIFRPIPNTGMSASIIGLGQILIILLLPVKSWKQGSYLEVYR